jgi:hypothetical protein
MPSHGNEHATRVLGTVPAKLPPLGYPVLPPTRNVAIRVPGQHEGGLQAPQEGLLVAENRMVMEMGYMPNPNAMPKTPARPGGWENPCHNMLLNFHERPNFNKERGLPAR